jgi:hypothetical protein
MMGVSRNTSNLLPGVGKHGDTGSSNQADHPSHIEENRYSSPPFRWTLNGLLVLTNLNRFRKSSTAKRLCNRVNANLERNSTPLLRKWCMIQLHL